MISNSNKTEWRTIQEVIGQVISNQPSELREADLKSLVLLLPELKDTRSYYQLIVTITKYEKVSKSKVEKRLSKSKENITE